MAKRKASLTNAEKRPAWENLLTQHLDSLKEHLDLWKDVERQNLAGSSRHSLAQACLSNTLEMIKNFEQLQLSFDGSRDTDEKNIAKGKRQHVDGRPHGDLDSNATNGANSSKRSRADLSPQSAAQDLHPEQDASGLFTIDTNPTPVDQLLSQQPTNKKGNKKSKQNSSSSAPHSSDHGAAAKTNAHGVPDALVEEDDSFLDRAAKRHEEKEAKRLQKQEKKRKRDSMDTLEAHATGDVKPGRRKKPKNMPTATDAPSETSGKKRKSKSDDTASKKTAVKVDSAGTSKKRKKM